MYINSEFLKIAIIILLFVLLGIIIAYFIVRKLTNKDEQKIIKQLRQGTKAKSLSTEIMYQKLYLIYLKIPFIKRYLIKLRRRLEIINVQDEYLTRKQSAKILTNMLLLIIPATILIIYLNRNNYLMLSILLISEIFFLDLYIDSRVDKVDNKLLKEQINFFTDIRHSYHEVNMVEEAIYQVTSEEEKEIARQGERIYDILNSDDPESELEKYYDVAPNSYLKEFAGISYLTREYGDRKDEDGASVYLKNLSHITEEMQLELLKRDKLDYTFQSLSVISILPMLFLEPLKYWAVNQFGMSAIEQFYNGKPGMIIQILILVITFICYTLIRKLKDNGSTNNIHIKSEENPWQNRVYNIPIVKQFIKLFIPKKGTRNYRKITNKLKEAAAKTKIEWLYVNRITFVILTFIISIFLCMQLHKVSIDYVYTTPTTDYDVIGTLSERDKIKAEELTKKDNEVIKIFKGKKNVTTNHIKEILKQTDYYKNATNEKLEVAAKRIKDKLEIVNNEYLRMV